MTTNARAGGRPPLGRDPQSDGLEHPAEARVHGQRPLWAWAQRSVRVVEIRERIEARLGPPTATGCREWQGAKVRGYGKIRIDDRTLLVHRVVWAQMHGPIPEGLDVLHDCDNPPCGEITHLWLGTQAENNADRAAKGRNDPQHGVLNHRGAKLTDEQVREIRHRRRSGETTVSLAREFGIAQSLVSRIANRKVWVHV